MSVLTFFISTKLGRGLALGAVALAALAWAYFHVKGIGYAECKAEWDRAEQAQIERGSGAREEAEREIPPVPEPKPAPDPAPVPKWMRDDPYNRDNH